MIESRQGNTSEKNRNHASLSSRGLRSMLTASVFAIGLCACATPGPRVSTMNLSQSAEQAYAAGRWQDAARYYDELLSLNPANSLGWFRLGNIALREKRTQDAISHYEAAIEVYGTDPRYWHNLAIARIRQAQDVLQQGQRVFIADRSKQASLKALDTRIDAIWQAPEAEDADVAGNFDSSQTLP